MDQFEFEWSDLKVTVEIWWPTAAQVCWLLLVSDDDLSLPSYVVLVVCTYRLVWIDTIGYDVISDVWWSPPTVVRGGNFNWLFFCGKRPLRFFPLLLSLIYFFRNSDKTEDNNRQTENLRRRTEENRTETAHHSSWEQLRSAKSEIGTPQAPPQELIRLSNHTL